MLFVTEYVCLDDDNYPEFRLKCSSPTDIGLLFLIQDIYSASIFMDMRVIYIYIYIYIYKSVYIEHYSFSWYFIQFWTLHLKEWRRAFFLHSIWILNIPCIHQSLFYSLLTLGFPNQNSLTPTQSHLGEVRIGLTVLATEASNSLKRECWFSFFV